MNLFSGFEVRNLWLVLTAVGCDNKYQRDLGKLCFGSATEHIVFVRSVTIGLVTNITNPINNYIIYSRLSNQP